MQSDGLRSCIKILGLHLTFKNTLQKLSQQIYICWEKVFQEKHMALKVIKKVDQPIAFAVRSNLGVRASPRSYSSTMFLPSGLTVASYTCPWRPDWLQSAAITVSVHYRHLHA